MRSSRPGRRWRAAKLVRGVQFEAPTSVLMYCLHSVCQEVQNEVVLSSVEGHQMHAMAEGCAECGRSMVSCPISTALQQKLVHTHAIRLTT